MDAEKPLHLPNTDRTGLPLGSITITVGGKTVTWPSRRLREAVGQLDRGSEEGE